MTGFDCESFDKILEKFSPMFSGHMPFDALGMIVEFEYVCGRKRFFSQKIVWVWC
jgi:hypothetical protein